MQEKNNNSNAVRQIRALTLAGILLFALLSGARLTCEAASLSEGVSEVSQEVKAHNQDMEMNGPEVPEAISEEKDLTPEEYFLIHGSGHNITCSDGNETVADDLPLYMQGYDIYQDGLSADMQEHLSDEEWEALQLQSDLEALEEILELEELAKLYAGTIPTRVMSDEGIEMLCGFEGLRLTAYKAVSTEQYYTIGYGHYGPDVTAGMTITKEQAVELLKSDVASRENYVNNFLKTNNLLYNQHQFDALVSFIYNIGTGNFSGSSIERLMKQGIENFAEDDIVYWISVWRKSGGQVLAGLEKRRAKESALFMRKDVELSSLDLQGKVTFNFYLDMPACVENANVKVVNGTSSATITNETKANDKGIAYAEISRIAGGTKVDTVKVTDIRGAKDMLGVSAVGTDTYGKYKLSFSVVLKDLQDAIQICLYDQSGKPVALYNANQTDGCSFRYSLAQYMDEVKKLPADTSNPANTKNAQLSTLLEQLNAFSQASRAYFGLPYDQAIVDGIAGNEKLTGSIAGNEQTSENMGGSTSDESTTQRESLSNSDSQYQKKIAGEVSGLTYLGSSLLLDSGTSIRHYFKPKNGYTISDFTFVCGGKSITPVAKGDYYYIAIENVAGSDLDTFYELKVTNKKNTAQSMAISYAAMSYGCDAYRNNGEESLLKVVNSMYLYNQAANIYFGK